MRNLVLRLAINFAGLYAAVMLLRGQGITLQTNNWLSIIWLAVIFSVVNALLKPILTLLTCPLLILTLGLGTLLINTLLFYLAGYIGTQFNVGFTVDGFLPAFLGALIVTVVSMLLNILLRDELKRR
jgi:putative membrane protein